MITKFIPKNQVIKITVNGNAVSLPVLILPGLNASTIAIAVGYGRKSAEEKKIQRAYWPYCH